MSIEFYCGKPSSTFKYEILNLFMPLASYRQGQCPSLQTNYKLGCRDALFELVEAGLYTF